MLRRFAATCWSLALGSALSSCGSAAPVGIGSDYLVPLDEPLPAPVVIEGRQPPPEPLPEPEELMQPEMPAPPPEMPGELDPLVDPEGGTASPYCGVSFQPCGGLLAGTWEVEDSCNPEVSDPAVLQRWGQNRMDLDPMACGGAVRRLTSTWSGQLEFTGKLPDAENRSSLVFDHRERAQTVEIELTSECLGPTLGLDDLTDVTPQICQSLTDSSTMCALAAGVCMCFNQTTAPGMVNGIYGVFGESVGVQDRERPLEEFDYCVLGDRLLWREESGSSRYLVLKRTVAAPAGVTDPVEIPR